jgi:YD repeat-containing protein
LSAQITEELPTLRTRFSRTYATRRGGRVARVFAGSVNYRTGGTWRAIDNRLARARDGDLENRANRYRVELPAELDEKPVVVRNGSARLGFELVGADDAAARAAGAHAVYADALPGVDVRYDALADAVKETLILKSAETPREYRFKLALSNGLKARLTRAGELKVVGRDGLARFLVPAPVAWQQGDENQPSGDHVRFAYDPADRVLTLRVDDAWLSAPGRRFPVSIDPWVQFPADEGDCTLSSADGEQSLSDCASTDLKVGNVDGSTYSSVLDLGLAARLPDWITVIEGYAGMYLKSAGGSDWQEFTMSALTRSFVDGEASWINAAAGTPWTNPGGDFSATPAMTHWMGPGADAPAWTFWAMPDQIQRWADGTDPDHGLILRATSAEPIFGATFSSTDESDSSHRPYVEVYYEPIHGEDGDFSFVDEDLPGIRSRVNVATGRLMVQDTDRSVTQDAPGFALDRFFNSADDRWGSPLQTGWKLGASASAYRSGNGDVSVEMPSGTVLRFAWDPDTQTYRPDRYDTASLTETGTELIVERGEDGERFFFDSTTGRLTKRERDGETGEVAYAYDSSGRLSTVTAPGSQVTTLHYDGDGRITSADLPGGDTVNYTFTDDRLTGRTVEGETTSYGYTDGRLSHVESPDGEVAFRYDADGRVTELIQVTDTTNDTGPTTTFAYHDSTELGTCPSEAAGRTVETQPDGTEVTHCYDAAGGVIDITAPVIAEPEEIDAVELWADGQGDATLDFAVSDEQSGVASVQVRDAAGAPVDERANQCPAGDCAPGLDGSFMLHTDGPDRSFTLRVVNGAGLDATLPVELRTDTTPPLAPEQVNQEAFDAAAQRLELSLDGGRDGEPEDGPQTGIARGELRWRATGGAWSPWLQSETQEFTLENIATGTEIEYEARVVDGAGLNSPALTGTLVAVEGCATPWDVDFCAEDDDRPIQAEPGTGPETLTVRIDPSQASATLASDADLSGMRVTVRTPDGQFLVDETDANGVATFPGVAAAEHDVSFVGFPHNNWFQDVERPVTPAGSTPAAHMAINLPKKCDILPDDYCTMTRAEKTFVARHPIMAVAYWHDQKVAIEATERMFDIPEPQKVPDSTKANAFLHSFWTGLMTKSAYDRVLDPVGTAMEYATAHESDAQASRKPLVKNASDMDMHNNKVGNLFAKRSEANRHSDYRICVGMRRATFGGKMGRRGATQLQLYWLRDMPAGLARTPGGCPRRVVSVG